MYKVKNIAEKSKFKYFFNLFFNVMKKGISKRARYKPLNKEERDKKLDERNPLKLFPIIKDNDSERNSE